MTSLYKISWHNHGSIFEFVYHVYVNKCRPVDFHLHLIWKPKSFWGLGWWAIWNQRLGKSLPSPYKLISPWWTMQPPAHGSKNKNGRHIIVYMLRADLPSAGIPDLMWLGRATCTGRRRADRSKRSCWSAVARPAVVSTGWWSSWYRRWRWRHPAGRHRTETGLRRAAD